MCYRMDTLFTVHGADVDCWSERAHFDMFDAKFLRNTDNGGPQKVESVQSTFRNLRSKYPQSRVFASTFEAFYAAAAADTSTMKALPVVTQEIGDTWLYGCPSDPLKNVIFRELSRRRAACVLAGQCDPEDEAMQRFDRLLTKIPEHTW